MVTVARNDREGEGGWANKAYVHAGHNKLLLSRWHASVFERELMHHQANPRLAEKDPNVELPGLNSGISMPVNNALIRSRQSCML